jgi:hypothetical protein
MFLCKDFPMYVVKAHGESGGTFRSFLLLNYAVRLVDCTDHSFLNSAFYGGDYSESNYKH